VYLDDDAVFAGHSITNVTSAIAPEDLAYVIYTSGSTGRPKGVAIRHQGVVNFLSAMRRRSQMTQTDRLLAVTSLSFDISVMELFLPLLVGGEVLIVSRDVAADGAALVQTLVESRTTVMFATPATWRAMLDAGWPADWPGRDRFTIFCGGEALSRELASQLVAHASCVWNLYGPTEATVCSTACLVEAGEGAVSIGRPIDNTHAYVVDRGLQPVPIGIPGELLIGGVGLARDYLNRPELTAEHFIPNPFSADPAARLYKTGDLVRLRADGNIEFLSRIDQQVKVRGLRIELGEIEAVLAEHPGVRQAVVVARDHGPNDKRLDAYVVAQPGHAEEGDVLRAFAKRTLPDYMVPSTFVYLDQLPLTPNGKVDWRALPDVPRDRSALTQAFVAPSTAMERVIAAVFADVLAITTVGVHDSFFDLGGHSLQGTQVLSRLRDLFAIDVSLTSLFQAPTVATMSALVADRQRARRPAEEQTAVLSPSILPRRDDGNPPPLSYAQKRLWFLNQLEPESPAYNLANAVRLQGLLHVEALERSLQEIVRRHESLRTLFASQEGQPVQIISADAPLVLTRHDCQHALGAERDAAVHQLIAEEAHRRFDLAHGPLLRVTLLRLDDQDHVLIFTIHHIVSDGWSVSVFARELAAIYESFSNGRPSPLPPLPIQYADYSEWQRQCLQGELQTKHLDYWQRQLDGSPGVLELPTDRPRPPIRQYRGAHHAFAIPARLTAGLQALSRQADATLFMVLLAAFQTLLYRYQDQDDIVVGSPIANRSRVETEGLIGVFINTLVLRTSLADNPGFRELIGRVRQMALEAYAHQDLPFELLVEALQPERSLSHSPLFQVMFVMQNTPQATLKLAGITLSPVKVERITAKFDLTLSIEEGANGLTGGFQYDTELFDAATIARMADHWLGLLSAVVADPDQPIAAAPMLRELERRQLLEGWNDARAIYPQTPVHLAFEAQVARRPDAVAVVCEDERVDYRELNRRANQLAHRLRALGIGREALVGLYVERSIESIVGILGILKAGGAYVPFDPTTPRQRVAFMLDDAGIAVLVTHQQLAAALPAHCAIVVSLDAEREALATGPDANPAVAVDPANLAYLIYTSGSAGRPKAVAVEHRQLTNYLHGAIERLELPAGASYATVSTLAADLGHTVIFPALLTGGTLHVISQERAADPEAFAAYVRRQPIDCLKIVPSHLAMLLSGRSSDDILPRKRLVLGGEASTVGWINGLVERAGGCAIFNHYGPTETTVGVLTCKVEPGTTSNAGPTLPLGRPLPNTQVYILDRELQPQPIGVVGELYIGGAGVARGYANRPDLTAERFVPNPFASEAGERLYRSGDLARYLPDGRVEFLGRADHQIKVRGYRVELDEIETILATHPAVAQAVVCAWHADDPVKPTRLAAYLVAVSNEAPTVEALRQFLNERLPDYMVPASFAILSALPLTPNGKIDRRALPEPDRDRPPLEQAFVPPATPLEHVLAGIWAEVLDVDSVGVHDNFFELGGHSLLATQVMARVFKVFQVELPLRRLFEAPTVAGLRDALLQIPGETEHIEHSAALLLQLAQLSDQELESQLADKLAGA
jgi:amino acid adenylation domain-containing protein